MGSGCAKIALAYQVDTGTATSRGVTSVAGSLLCLLYTRSHPAVNRPNLKESRLFMDSAAQLADLFPFFGLFFFGSLFVGFLILLFVGRAIAMWWLGVNEVLKELRAIVIELRTLRAEIAALNAPPPALS